MDLDDFKSKFNPRPRDLLILDLYHAQPDGSLKDMGSQYFQDAIQNRAIVADRTFVLTGYPEKASDFLQNTLPESHLFAKPPNMDKIVGHLLEKITAVE